MLFEEAIHTFDTLVTNGPLGTRLKYDYGLAAAADLMEREAGRKALAEIYAGDIAVAQEYRLPMILNAATFRASKHHLRSAGFSEPADIRRINTRCIRFLQTLRERYAESSAPIFIGAPLGSMYDAYSVDVIPGIEEAWAYHAEQIHIFKGLGVDFVNVVTLPSLAEAIGISLAAECADISYTIGFILNRAGTLLDGTPLEEAIQAIDARTEKRRPLGYLITCTHASVIARLTKTPDKYGRLIGAQLNGSSLLPKELAGMDKPVADSPEKFAAELIRLKTCLGLRIIGGCCGTTRDHLRSISQACAPASPVT